MANPLAFLEIPRESPPYRAPKEALRDFREAALLMDEQQLARQASRCMDCGIPFCQTPGCPLQNRIPDWCALVSNGDWNRALDLLHSTVNFPEITGRICPAPCESLCTIPAAMKPVIIRHIELQIAEYGWKSGRIVPEPPSHTTGKKVAIIGSGPAGLTAAQQLARLGHTVTVFEKEDRAGGGLRYGIPDFVLEKRILDRRIEQMTAEGVVFETGVSVGDDLSVKYVTRSFDAIILAVGSPGGEIGESGTAPTDATIYAADFLIQQNRRMAGESIPDSHRIDVAGKDIAIIGSGHIAEYCIGACLREGARNIRQLKTPKGAADAGADIVFITSGSQRRDHKRLIDGFGLSSREDGGIITDERGIPSKTGVFATGGCVPGITSAVDSMHHGRTTAAAVDAYLKGDA